ncbi:MAG: acyl carrier protein [Muribaculaceae bacterium]|jgi:acyl carrier protein|nr:acyl carrier protein [Muribaculaceae bacterium]
MNEIAESVKQMIVEKLAVAPEQVTPEATFAQDLGADSLDTVELIMALEEKFEVEIPESASEKIQTVQDAIDFIVAAKGK